MGSMMAKGARRSPVNGPRRSSPRTPTAMSASRTGFRRVIDRPFSKPGNQPAGDGVHQRAVMIIMIIMVVVATGWHVG